MSETTKLKPKYTMGPTSETIFTGKDLDDLRARVANIRQENEDDDHLFTVLDSNYRQAAKAVEREKEMWRRIHIVAHTNPAIKEALDQVVTLYLLSVEHGPKNTPK